MYDFTNLSQEEIAKLLRKHAQARVMYITEDGDRVPAKWQDSERAEPLTAPVPHPVYGIVDVEIDSHLAATTVKKELGRDAETADEYLATLTAVSYEKGWRLLWPVKRKAKPPAKRTAKKRRGRPPGSKDKKPRKRRSKADG